MNKASNNLNNPSNNASNNKINREDFLRASGLVSLTGLGLFAGSGGLSTAKVFARSKSTKNRPADISIASPVKSVIFINLAGGASHVDSFDPKPGNGPFKSIDSSIRGAKVTDRLAKTAGVLKHVSLIRSVYSEEGDHSRAQYLLHSGHRMMAGFRSQPSVGGVIAYAKQKAGPYFPEHITIGGRGGLSGEGGFLGVRFDSYHIGNVDRPLSNLTPRDKRLTEDRFYRREQILDAINTSFAGRVSPEETAVWSEMHESALAFMNSDKLAVFDLAKENATTRKRFGESRMGKALLMAKRLAAAEVPFTEISMGGWDTHNNNRDRVGKLLGELDGPVAALIGELKSSGLFDQTLFVLGSEFGRTPVIAGNGDGRDHHPRAWTMLIGGGKVPAGTVIGATDDKGHKPTKDPAHVSSVVATMYAAAGVDPQAAIYTSQGRPMQLITKHQPIRGLAG
ncbi:MAG: DUF1501 domain-containing protein [Leptospirales bacterium]